MLFLIIDEPPQKADVIVSGDREARLQRGIELYRQGYAPYLLFTSSTTGLEKEQAIAEGVPEDAFILDRQEQNTYQNAAMLKL